jgi:hypothetical protein
MTSTISPAHVSSSEHVSTSEHVSVPEPVVPEHIVPEQLASTIPETISEPNNIITSDATDMEIKQSVSTVVIESVSDQPSTSYTPTSNFTDSQSSS